MFVDISIACRAAKEIAFNVQRSVARNYNGALDHVLQFAHVSRPVVRLQKPERLSVDTMNFTAQALCMVGGETCNERSDVFEPFAKGWNPDREYIQAIREIVAEPAVARTSS